MPVLEVAGSCAASDYKGSIQLPEYKCGNKADKCDDDSAPVVDGIFALSTQTARIIATDALFPVGKYGR